MNIQNNGMRAYNNALFEFEQAQKSFKEKDASVVKLPTETPKSFSQTLDDSLKNVNDLQTQKTQMIESFASGETQNVHELMITLQKSGLAVSMTSAVRNKVLEAYKELTRLQF